jgi:hypothetical protein
MSSSSSAPTTFVGRLIDENNDLRQQLLHISAELRAIKSKPGSAEAFAQEIEALSGAIRALHAAHDAANAALPPASRIAQLEDSMLTDSERAALREQRARVKATIDSTFGAARVDALVDEELRRKRRQRMELELERESVARGANVLNVSSTPASSLAAFNSALAPAAANYAPSPRDIDAQLPSARQYMLLRAQHNDATPSTPRGAGANNANGPAAMMSPTLLSPLTAASAASPSSPAAEAMARAGCAKSVVACISKEREERQQMLIANCTPLRAQLLKAQEEAFRLLRREMADEGVSAASSSSGATGSDAAARRTLLADLEKHHAEFIANGHVAAAAISV